VRVFHTSDTHLGHSQYPRTGDDGLNVRESDIYAAWHKVVDAAVAEKPDLFIHAGDLFDGVRPSNRALAHAMEGFLKLSRAGIPTVAIAGNHEHPKLRETGSPFRLFAHLPNVRVAYQGRRETIELPGPAGPVRVHAVPQCQDAVALHAEISSAPTAPQGTDILVVHGAVPSLPAFSHAEFNELTLDPAAFAPFDYVALGHYHGVQEVAPNAWYCGAPERVSIAEAGQEKGFLEVQLGTETPVATFRPLGGRTYVDLPVVDCSGLDAAGAKASALSALACAEAGAVVRLRLSHLDASLRGALDVRAIRQGGAQFLQLDLRLDWEAAAGDLQATSELRPLAEEFEAYAARQPIEGVDRERLVSLARGLFAEGQR
jgi:exonuclease SbcD